MVPNLMRKASHRDAVRQFAHEFYENAFEYADVVVEGKDVPSDTAKQQIIDSLTETFCAVEWWEATHPGEDFKFNAHLATDIGNKSTECSIYGLDLSLDNFGDLRERLESLTNPYFMDTVGNDIADHICDLRDVSFTNVTFSDCDFSDTHIKACQLANANIMFDDVVADASLASRTPVSFDDCYMLDSFVGTQDSVGDDYRAEHAIVGNEVGIADGDGKPSVLKLDSYYNDASVNYRARDVAKDWSFDGCEVERNLHLSNHSWSFSDVTFDDMTIRLNDQSISLDNCTGKLEVLGGGTIQMDSCDLDKLSFSGKQKEIDVKGGSIGSLDIAGIYSHQLGLEDVHIGKVMCEHTYPHTRCNVNELNMSGVSIDDMEGVARYDDSIVDMTLGTLHVSDSYVNSNPNVNVQMELYGELVADRSSFKDIRGDMAINNGALIDLSHVATLGERIVPYSMDIDDTVPIVVSVDQVSDEALRDWHDFGQKTNGVMLNLSGTNLDTLPASLDAQEAEVEVNEEESEAEVEKE